MSLIPTKTVERLSRGIKKYQKILAAAKMRDVNESDTSVIVTDMLSDIFGYDKYSEITTETAIRGTYCDLAIMIDGNLRYLIETKAIGLDLKEAHIKQAVDYASNKGMDWVVLTNGIIWQIYKIIFSKPIEKELVAEFNFLTLSSRNRGDVEQLYLLAKEGVLKEVLAEYHIQKQTTSKYIIGNILVSEDILKLVKKKLRDAFPGVKVTIEELKEILEKNVCKREIFEGEDAELAKKKLIKALNKKMRLAKNGQRVMVQKSENTLHIANEGK